MYYKKNTSKEYRKNEKVYWSVVVHIVVQRGICR